MLLRIRHPFELRHPRRTVVRLSRVFRAHLSRVFRAGVVLFAVAGCATKVLAFDPSILTEVGMNVSELFSYSHPPFANSLLTSYGNWLECNSSNSWGTSVAIWNNAQFDVNGYPKYLKLGTTLRGVVFANATTYDNRPSTWPFRGKLALGKVLITWRGEADIRAAQGTFVSGESNGASTGRLINGRRTYMCTNTLYIQSITINDINSNSPPTDIKVWLPDPANPNGATLEGQYFHPTYLARLADAHWAFLRFMKWTETMNSPQQDWSDRRLPTHVFQQGRLNPRPPVTGGVSNEYTGVAYEHLVSLCNTSGINPWVTVPHLATADFITKMAQLFRYGSDGVNPYTNDVANPVYPPLNTNLVIYVEYSNEIWNTLLGETFWAQAQANALGITPQQFVARRFCDTWRIFQTVFGGTSRLVRVAAVGTGQQTYTTGLLNEIASYGPTLTPPQTADVVAPTTYFGNGIQDWTYSKAQQQAGTADQWFFTTNTFLDGTTTKPVSIAASDPYWTNANVYAHLDQTFTEWRRRLLSGSAQTGGGPDANGVGGGFDVWLRAAITNAFGVMKPLVTYEGGPSIYTNPAYDGSDVRDDGITTFFELLNRQPGMRDVYRIHLNMAKAKGLRTHGAFNEVESYGKYGQWGHLEYLDQPPTNSVKWTFLRDWFTEISPFRPVDNPLNATPSFTTAANLPTAIYLQPCTNDILVTGGDGTNTMDVVGSVLPTGLSVTNVAGDPNRLRISGTPLASGDSYVLARVRDADGDPAWRTFYFHVAGGPGVIVESNFGGTNPAQHLPWTSNYVLSSGVTCSGWNKGAGIIAQAGTNALIWVQNQPMNESSSTLALSIASNQYWTFTITPVAGQPLNLRKAEMRFTICRIAYNAPRDYAVFTSVGGFAAGAQVFDTGHFTDQTSVESILTLPDTAAYGNLTTPVEFRLVGYSGQYGSQTSLTAFKLTGLVGPTIITSSPLPSGTVGMSYVTALVTVGGTAPLTWSVTSGGLPDGLSLSSGTGVISGSPTAYGTWSFALQVSDANSLATTQQVSLTINPTAWQSWQLRYFGSTNTSLADPNADPLHKGMRNYDQFLAGLDPTNAGSVFRITSMLLTGADFVIRWNTAGVRTNIVQTATTAVSSGFHDVGIPVVINVAGDTNTTYTVVGGATNSPAQFYRIRIGP